MSRGADVSRGLRAHHDARSISGRILAALEAGPMHHIQIEHAIGRDYSQVAGPLRNMRKAAQIVIVGRCGPLGFAECRIDAPVYALPGHLPEEVPGPKEVKVAARQSAGQIAQPRVLAWKPFKRDPFEHMKLALATRS